jgi:hypothetical protein
MEIRRRRRRCEVRGGVLRLYKAWGCGCFFIHAIGRGRKVRDDVRRLRTSVLEHYRN